MGSKCCKCSTEKAIASSSSVGSCPRSRVWEEGRGVYFMEGETEWARAEGPPLLSRRLTDQAVKVGTRTRLLVEIASSSPLTVVWLHEGKKVEENERVKLVNEGNFYCVDISPVTLDDEGVWKCQGHNARGLVTSQAKLTLVVPRAYKKPEFVEPLRAVLGSAGTVSLETKVIGVPTPTLKWYKEGEEIKPGDVLGLTPDPLDPTLGTYTCIATNCMGSTVSTSRVHVVSPVQPKLDLGLSTSGPKPIFAKELRNEKVKIGTTLSLECQVKVPPWPDRVSWYNSVGEVKEGPRAHLMEDGMGGYSIRVSPIQASDDGTWRFVATNRGGATSVTTCSVSVSHPKNYRKPKFLDSLKAVLTEEGLVSFECKVVGYPTPLLSWFKDGQELKPGDVYQLTGTNSLGSYCCIARNCMGEAESTAVLTVEDIQSQLTEEERLQLFSDKLPPKFIQGLKSMEAKISEPFSFSVKVSVSPEPTVLWFRDDEHIDESEPRYKLEKDKLGLYSLHIARLEFIDQAEWKCVAMNDFGQSVTSSYLKLNIPRHYKKPKFLEELRAVLSDEGAVNLECKVIGVPQPVLKWFKDGKELKPGDIHRIISGQDGSCCLGTYTCMAQNCMGTVSSSASLLGFQDKGIVGSGVTPKVPEKTNTCVRDTSLSTIQEERTSQLHDTDKSLTLDDRPEEVSFSFDGREVSVSLYETPDLTEEEALQIVEMYADQISEHVSEHNVVELPPMRFTKESSTSGKLLMEAMVIDVSPDYFTPGEVDDLRTDADLEEFSLVEEAMVTPEEEKPDIEFPSSPTRPEEAIQSPGRKLSPQTLKEEKPRRKKRKSTDSDKEDDSLQEFERRKTEKRPFKERKRTESEMEDDSLYEFESRKVIGQNESKLVESKTDQIENVSESCIEVFESGERPSVFKTAELISPGHSRRSLTEDDKTYNTAEESAFDKSEMSVLETLAQSLQEIQRGLAFVEAKVISESQELLSPEASILESLAHPIAEVQRSLEVMEEKLDEALIGSQVLETLVQPISEFKKSLKMIEEEEALKRKASSIMESLARPLQELEREIALIQEQCYPQRQMSSEERYAKSVEEVQETLTRIIERQESVPHDRKLMKTISVELQELEETANDDLEQYYDRLLACSSELRKKLNDEHDQEIVDILRSMGDLVKPLKRLSAVTSKCISVIVKDYELGGMPSAKLVESLVKPLEALKSSLDLLESVSNLKSHRAIRGVGIPLLYKMSVPMEELQTTIKLVENLSAHTAVEFLVAPLENLIKVVSTIDISSGGEGFLENLGKEGPELVKDINNSLNTIKSTMSSIKANVENVESERELIEKLPNIVKPMEDLQRSLKPIQENIGQDLSYDEVCEVAQNLSKPLQSLRSELSILQHEIEIEHYGDITGEKKSVLSELIEPLEAVQSSIKCFHESILCKEDPIHLRFVLYALKEMAEPFNTLCSKVTKTEQAILQGKVLDPYQGLKNVTKAVRELKETSSLTKADLPVVHGISSTLSKPLDSVENGLSDILYEIYNSDKGDLNINMLKNLAEPFMALQSALLDIESQSLSTGNELPELKQAIKDLQRSVLVIQDHVSFEYGDEPSTTESNIVMLESLVQPLQLLRSQISDIQRASLRTLIKTDRVLTDIRDSSKDIIAAIKVQSEENDPLSELLKKLGKTVEQLGVAADVQNIQIGQGQMLEEARCNMANVLVAVATSFGETCAEADELSTKLNTEQRKTLVSIQDMILDLKSAVETAVEIMDEKKVGIEQNIATASALEQVKCAMYDFNHSFSSMNEVQPKPPKKSISMDELKDFVVQLESDVNLVIDKISSTVDRKLAQPVLDNILDDVKSVKYAVLKIIEERDLDENRIQYVLEKVKFIENDLNELSQNTLEHEYIPLNEACKTAQAIVSMQDQLIPNSKDEYDYQEVIDSLVENVNCLEMVVEKVRHHSKDPQNDNTLVTICENLMILQECITPLTSGEKQKEMLGEQLRQMKLPIKVIEQSLHNIKFNKEDMNEALQALNKVSEICIKKDSLTNSECFGSESLYESIDSPLINTITDTIESMRSTFKNIKDKKPVKLAWFIDSFEETLVKFGKELSDNISNFDEPQVRQKMIESVGKLKSEISDLRIMESGPLNELKKAVMSLDAVIMEPPEQILPALQNIVKPLNAIHENICNLDMKLIRKEEFKYLEDYSKASNDLEIGLMKLEKALITSEELDFKVMSKPLEVLYTYVESISDNPIFEYIDEDSSIVQLSTLSEHIAEIKTCLDAIEATVTVSPGDQKKIEALLINVAKPVRELQHNVALIQEQALLMNVELKSSELEDLKEAVAVVCSHVEGNEDLRTILNPVYALKEKLEKATPESFNPTDIAYPVKEFKIVLEEIEKENKTGSEFSCKERISEPFLDLCYNVIQIIENRLMESIEPKLTSTTQSVEHAVVKNAQELLVRAVPVTVETELCEEENELMQHVEMEQEHLPHEEVAILKQNISQESISKAQEKNDEFSQSVKLKTDEKAMKSEITLKTSESQQEENNKDPIKKQDSLKNNGANTKDEGNEMCQMITKDVKRIDLDDEKKVNIELKSNNEENIVAKNFEDMSEVYKDKKACEKPSTSIEIKSIEIESKVNEEKKHSESDENLGIEKRAIPSNQKIAKDEINNDTLMKEKEGKVAIHELSSRNEEKGVKALVSEAIKEDKGTNREDNIYKNGKQKDETIKIVEESKQVSGAECTEESEKKISQDTKETTKKPNEQKSSDHQIEVQLKIDKSEGNDDSLLKGRNKIEEAEIEENKNRECNTDILQTESVIEKQEVLQTKEDLNVIIQEKLESEDKQQQSMVAQKLSKLNVYIKQLESEIISSISIISKTNAKFSVKPILESVLIDIKSMDRVVEKLLQDQKVDCTRLKFIVDKARFIGEDLKFVLNSSLLKEECQPLNAASKTVKNIMLLHLIEEQLKEEEAEEAKIKMTELGTEKIKEEEKNISKKEMEDNTKSKENEEHLNKTDSLNKQEGVLIIDGAKEQKGVKEKDIKSKPEDEEGIYLIGKKEESNKENEVINEKLKKDSSKDELKMKKTDEDTKDDGKEAESKEVEKSKVKKTEIKMKTEEENDETLKVDKKSVKSVEVKINDKKEIHEEQGNKQMENVEQNIKEKKAENESKVGENKNDLNGAEQIQANKEKAEKENKTTKEVKEKGITEAEAKKKKEEEENTVIKRKDEEEKAKKDAGAKIKEEEEKERKEMKEEEEKAEVQFESIKKESKEKDKLEAEAKKEKGEEEESRKEAETKQNKDEEEKLKIKAEAKKKKEEELMAKKAKDEEEKTNLEGKAKNKKEGEEKANLEGNSKKEKQKDQTSIKELEVKKAIEEEEKPNAEAEAKKREVEEEKKKASMIEAADKTKKEEEGRLEAESKKNKEEKAEIEAEAKNKKKNDEKAKIEVEAYKKKEERNKLESEAKKPKDEEEKEKLEAKTWKKIEEEKSIEIEVEAKKKKEEEEKAKQETDAKKKEKEDEEKAKIEAVAKKKNEVDEKAKIEAESKNKKELEEKAKLEGDAKKRKGEEEKAKIEAEAKSKKEEEEEKLNLEAEAKKKKKEDNQENIEAGAKQKIEDEKAKLEAEAKKKKEEEKKAKIEAEANMIKETEEKARIEADANKKKKDDKKKAKIEAEAKKKTEEVEKDKLEAEAMKKNEGEEKAKQETEAEKKKVEEEKAKLDSDVKKKKKEDQEKAKTEAEGKNKKEEEEKVKMEAEAKKKKEEEEKAKLEAEAKKKKQEEEKAKIEAEAKKKKEEEEKAKLEAEANKKKEEEEKAKIEAEAMKKKEEEEKAKLEAEAKKKKEEEEKAKIEAEAKKKKEEEEKAKLEAEAKKKKQEEEKAKIEAKKKKEEEEKAKIEAEAKKKKEEEEKAKLEAEAKKKKEEEEKAKLEAEAKKKKQEEEKAKIEAEAKKKKEEEEKAKLEAEAKKKKEEEEKANIEAEAKKKKEEEEKAKQEAEAKKKKEEEEKAKIEVEAKKKKEEEEKAKLEAEAKKKKEEEEKAKIEAKKKKEEEEKAKLEAEAKKKKDKEEKAKIEAEVKKKKEEEEKAKLEAEAKKKKEEEEKAKLEAEDKKKKEEEEKAKLEADSKKKKEEEEKAKIEVEAKKKKEEEEKAKLEAEAKKKKEVEEKAKIEAKKKKEEEEKAKLEAETKKKKEEEEKAKFEAEAKKKKEEEEKAKLEAEAKKKKEEEEKAMLEAEAKKKKQEEEKAKIEVEAKKKKEEEEKAKLEAEAKKKKEVEEKAKIEAKKKKEEEEKAKLEAKKKKEEEEKAKLEAEAKKKKEEEEKAMLEAEAKKKKEEEEKAMLKAEAKKKKEEEEKAKLEADSKKKKEGEEKAKIEAEAKKKKEEEEKIILEAEAKKKKEEEEKIILEAEAKKKKEEEEKIILEAEAKKKKEDEERARQEVEAKKKKEEEEKAKKEVEAKKIKEEEEKTKKKVESKAAKVEEEKIEKVTEANKAKEEEEKAMLNDECKKKKGEEEKTKKEKETLKKVKKESEGKKQKEEEAIKKKEDKFIIEAESNKKELEEGLVKHDSDGKKEIGENVTICQVNKVKKVNNEDISSVLTENILYKEPDAETVKKLELIDEKCLKESRASELDEILITRKEMEKDRKKTEKDFVSETNVRLENQKNIIEVVELDPEDQFFWVGKGSSGSANTYKYPGSDSGYSENIKSYVQSSPSSRKYLIDGNLNTDTNYISPRHLSRSSSYDTTTSTTSYLNQSKLKQYLAQSGSDISQDLSPRSYPIQEDYSKKDFSVIHSSRPTEFLMKDYTYNTGSPALDSIRRRIDKSWKNLNRHMSHEYLSSGVKSDVLSKEFGGSADQLSSKEIYKEFLYVPYKEDFSPLAQSRRYTRRRSASPLPVFSDSTAMVRQRSVSRSRYEYHEKPPYICSPLRDKRVEHGANVKLTCNIGGDPEPIVEWRKDGQPIESIIDRFVVEYSFGVASLEIRSVIASDAGQYTCVAINPAGQAATTATLRINTEHWQGMDEYGLSQEISLPLRVPEVSPRVTGLIADSLVPSGGVIALHLQIQGCPRAEVTWLREGVPLKFSPRTHTLVDPSMGLHTFLVEGVTVSESGLYHCRVLSGSSRLLEPAPAHIQVVERRPGDKPALITARPDTRITLTSGEDLTLTCYVSGEPKPRVMLMKGIKDITDGDRTLKESFGEYVRLTLKRALPEDSGTYFIVARNPYGTDRAFSTVKIRERTRSLTPTRRERSSSVYRELCNGSSSLSLSYL